MSFIPIPLTNSVKDVFSGILDKGDFIMKKGKFERKGILVHFRKYIYVLCNSRQGSFYKQKITLYFIKI